MVGAPGTGKSTWIKNNGEKNSKLLSSDNIRMELFGELKQGGDASKEVFYTLHSRLINGICNGKEETIYYDATNLSRKRRRGIYSVIKAKKPDAVVHTVYMSMPLDKVLERNNKRTGEKRVPDAVVIRMYKNQQVPRIGVDTDTVEVVGEPITHDTMNTHYTDVEGFMEYVTPVWKDELSKVFTPHDCLPWHVESVDEHINMAIKNAMEESLTLSRVALFHDLGKGVTKEFKEGSEKASYNSHASVSSSYLLNYFYFLREGKITVEDWEDIETIHQHMNAHDGIGAKNARNNKLDESTLNKIEDFKKIDSVSKVKGGGK